MARPIHVLYGGAHLYTADSAAKMGRIALASMDAFAKDAVLFGRLVGLADDALAATLAARVRQKLEADPVEATCIDFEDGYGPRSDEEEDADAIRAATELARTVDGPIVGIRIKPLATETEERALRTLDFFVRTLATHGPIAADFAVTLPKVSRSSEVATLVTHLTKLENAVATAHGTIRIELMIETPRGLLDETGRVALPALVAAANGRCIAAHLGAYDLTASLGVAASDQRLDHPACDAARMLMQIALAGTGVAVVDGATTILPVGKDASAIHDAWKMHALAIRRALSLGIYEGWDVHPAQLPARYGAVYAFFLGEHERMAARLRAFVDRATQATRTGRVFDDAATGQGLLNFFLRGIACGALDASEAAGLTEEELAARSFAQIVAARS